MKKTKKVIALNGVFLPFRRQNLLTLITELLKFYR